MMLSSRALARLDYVTAVQKQKTKMEVVEGGRRDKNGRGIDEHHMTLTKGTLS